MNESKFRSLGEWFSREEMVWRGRKCKWRKWVNSDNGGRKKSEEEGLKLKDEDKGDEVKKTQQLKFDWVDSVHSQKKKKFLRNFFVLFFFKREKNKKGWMKKKISKIFKDRWHQFQEKFNFGGKKIKFQRWSRTKGIIFQKKKVWNSKFQISNFKFQISKEKKNFKELQKSTKVFLLKREIQVKEKRKRKITHLKIVEQQETHHLKSNPKFWSFAGKTSGSKIEKPIGYLLFRSR